MDSSDGGCVGSFAFSCLDQVGLGLTCSCLSITLVVITKAAVQPPLLAVNTFFTLFALANECAASSFLFTFHKPRKQLVYSLPFNPKLCVPSLSTIFNMFKINVKKGEVLFGRHLNRQGGNLLPGCLGGHGAGVSKSQ
jgi:hypothetical protein